MNEQELQDAAKRLPKSIDPPEDLWPGIRERIGRRAVQGGPGRTRRRWTIWVPFAVAATVVGILLLRPRGESWVLQRVA